MSSTPKILPLSKRLSYKQAKLVVLIAVGLGILFSCLQIYLDFFLFQKEFDNSLQQMIEITRRPATQAIASRNSELAAEILEGFIKYEPIAEVGLLDEKKQPITPLRQKLFASTYGRHLTELIFGNNEKKPVLLYLRGSGKFGILTITLDNHSLVVRFLDRALVVLMSGLARNLLLAIIVLFLFHRIVTKPLFNIATSLGNIDLFRPELNRLPYLRNHNEDELGQLVTSVNQLLSTIDERIKEREKILHEMKIAKQIAESANQAKTEFLTNMSHEMRTPLNGVLNMILLAQESSLTKTQRDYLDVANRSGMVLLNLISDILDFSKIETGEISLENATFNLPQMVEEAVEILVDKAETKQLELITFIATDVPQRINSDPIRLRQVIVNLVDNAIKFTTQGEILITVNVAKRAPQETILRFEVADTGIGIAQHALTTIFGLFEQIDGSTTRRYGGVGLGLTLSKEIITKMGGDVGVKSVLGQGSTFWFTVPFQFAETDTTELPEKFTTQWRLLIVDTNVTVRKYLSYWLQNWGMTVENVPDAKQAFNKIRDAYRENRPFDLVLVDMNLSDLDGISFALALKADIELASTRLILLTSYYYYPVKSTIFCAYLRKPISQTHLYQIIQRIMQSPFPEGTS